MVSSTFSARQYRFFPRCRTVQSSRERRSRQNATGSVSSLRQSYGGAGSAPTGWCGAGEGRPAGFPFPAADPYDASFCLRFASPMEERISFFLQKGKCAASDPAKKRDVVLESLAIWRGGMQHRPDIRANKAAFPEKDIGDEPGDTFLPARQRAHHVPTPPQTAAAFGYLDPFRRAFIDPPIRFACLWHSLSVRSITSAHIRFCGYMPAGSAGGSVTAGIDSGVCRRRK